MTMVVNLRTGNTTNNTDIATQEAVDDRQDNTIDKLDTNITSLEVQVAELVRSLNLVKLRVAQLPDLVDLKASLKAIKDKNDLLGPQAD